MLYGLLSKEFHKKTTQILPRGVIPSDSALWPKEWGEIEHKEYVRMPKILLESPQQMGISFEEMLSRRTSLRNFDVHKGITKKELSTILYWSLGKKSGEGGKSERRHYPSGGARYPVEGYVALRNSSDIPAGLYHYNVKDHVLECLGEGEEDYVHVQDKLTYPWSKDAPCIFIYTTVWNRNFMKYRDFGYRIVLLETGHAAQNAVLTATGLGVGACTLAGFKVEELAEVLDLDFCTEAPTYVVAFGHPKNTL